MTKQFEANNLENIRVSAYTPNDLNDILITKTSPLSCGNKDCKDCKYEYACLCSHMKAIKKGLDDGNDYFIILEDDIFLNFNIDYNALLNDIPKDTEILQLLILYGNSVINLYKYYKSTGNKYLKWKYILPSAGMYIISKNGAKRLIELFYNTTFDKYDFDCSPHQKVADILLYETLNTYVINIPYVYPYIEMGSEIHPHHLDAHKNAINDIKKIISLHDIDNFPFVLGESKYII